MDAHTRSALATAFLSAPLESGGWDRALRLLAAATNSPRAQLIGIGGSNVVPFNKITDTSQADIDQTARLGLYTPDVNWRIATTGRPLELISENHYRAAAETMRFDIYDDFSEWFGCQFGCQTTLRQNAASMIGLAVLRTRQDGETDADDRGVFAEAAPYVLNATRMQEALQHQGAHLISGAFEAMNAPAFVCDPFGRVMALTPAAEAALSTSPVLKLADRFLSALRPDDDRLFQETLAQALTGDVRGAACAPIWLGPASGPLDGCICEIFALPAQEWGLGFEARAVVTLRAPAAPDAIQRNLLRQAFQLTPAEAEIAMMAAAGLSREEIARRRNATLHTVNSQLKSIFAKTNAGREAELVALLNQVLR